MDYEKVFERLFETKNIEEQLHQMNFSYFNSMFDDITLTYEKVIIFINKFKNELIESALNDKVLINNILYENMIIDTTKAHLITKEYIENLINKINNKEFEPKVITFYLYIIQIHNLFVNKYDETTLKEILNLNLVSILDTPELVSEDGDTFLGNNKKLELTDKFLSWNKKCGKEILPYIFQLDTLKEYITILINSNQIKDDLDYQNRLSNLLKICEYSIIVRDKDITPTKEEVEQINKLFYIYDLINKSIIIDNIKNNNVMLIHFIRDNEVNYQLVGNDIIDITGNNNNEFDSRQSEFFINSYYEYIVSIIEKQTGKSFDINNQEMRKMLNEELVYYNNIINYKPLDRLPIKKREIAHNLRTYIRETDNKLSCSFILNLNDKPTTHLNRKIGLIISPTKDGIISTSLGYTEENDLFDFKNNSVPCTEIFSKINTNNFVNETCVDTNKCEVIGVLVLSDEKNIVERAEKIANIYNTKIVRLIKNDIQTIKH